MKNKQTETKSRPTLGLTRHLIGGVLCLAVISLICARASAQNLFATDYLSIDEFTPNGVQSTFASSLNNPLGLTFDKAGNLFVADTGTYTGTGAVYKFTPTGVRTTFATVQSGAYGLAFDRAGNLFVAAGFSLVKNDNLGTVYKFTP